MAADGEAGAKLGSTALAGYWRQGLAELRAAAPYGDATIAQPTDYGMPGMATPGEVGEARRDEPVPLDGDSVVESRLQAAMADRDDRGRDDRDLELD